MVSDPLLGSVVGDDVSCDKTRERELTKDNHVDLDDEALPLRIFSQCSDEVEWRILGRLLFFFLLFCHFGLDLSVRSQWVRVGGCERILCVHMWVLWRVSLVHHHGLLGLSLVLLCLSLHHYLLLLVVILLLLRAHICHLGLWLLLCHHLRGHHHLDLLLIGLHLLMHLLLLRLTHDCHLGILLLRIHLFSIGWFDKRVPTFSFSIDIL